MFSKFSLKFAKMIIIKKTDGVKGAIVFTLIFFTFISYLYSLRMKTMSLSEVNMSFKLVWLRATKFELGDNRAKLVVECLCKTLLGWFYNCCGRDRPLSLYIRNYTFETWLVYMIAYLFIIVWFLLKVFEYYGNQKELKKLIEERLWRLRSECSGGSELDLADYVMQTEIAVHTNDGKECTPNIQISRIFHNHDVQSSNQNAKTQTATSNQEAETCAASTAKIKKCKESSSEHLESESPEISQVSNAFCRVFNQDSNTTRSTYRTSEPSELCSTTDTRCSSETCTTGTQDSNEVSRDFSQDPSQTCTNFMPVRYKFRIPRQKRTFSESDIFETLNRKR